MNAVEGCFQVRQLYGNTWKGGCRPDCADHEELFANADVIQRLEAALAATGADTNAAPVLVDLAKRTLTELRRLRMATTLKNIIDHVEREFRLEAGTLKSRKKTQRIAMARQIGYYLCRTISGASFPTIAESMGRDHSSIHHGFYLIQGRMARDAAFRLAIEKIERRILATAATSAIAVAA